jgi:hypothetical protein
MEWLIANWDTILLGVTGIISGASIIAKLTPTETDDKILAKILRFIDLLAINNKPTELRKK